MVIGTGIGLRLAFRGRHSPSRIRASFPPLFRDGRPNQEGVKAWSGLWFKSAFFSVLGAAVGAEIGTTTGVNSMRKILDEGGTLDRINEAIKKVKRDVDQKEREARGEAGAAGPYVSLEDAENTPLAAQFAADEPENRPFVRGDSSPSLPEPSQNQGMPVWSSCRPLVRMTG
jgi:hypothetical protein